MSLDDKLSDDYVAGLLAKDAKDRSIKYSSYGFGGLLPKRPTTNAPKPNTRFLKNIIKETDSHNAALKAKEAEEARARLRRLREETNGSSNLRVDDPDRRSAKRQRVEQDDDGVIRKGRGHRREETLQDSRDYEDRVRRRGRRRQEDDSSEDERAERSRRHRHHREHRSHRSRSREKARGRDGHRSRREHHRHRSRTRSRSPRPSKHRHSHRRRSRSASSSSEVTPVSKKQFNGRNGRDSATKPLNGSKKRARSPTPNSASDSDPLASIVGPPPPPSPPKVRARGRGTFASNSGIDTRFSNTYDPTTDIHPNSDSENDWDQALEALRDRQKWKQQGADRLREAGFTEQEVQKWEKSGPGGEKREEDVVWRGEGEGREWDRGKVVGEDGDSVVTKAEWGRLV